MDFQIPRAGMPTVVVVGLTKLFLALVIWGTGSEWLDKVITIMQVYKGGE